MRVEAQLDLVIYIPLGPTVVITEQRNIVEHRLVVPNVRTQYQAWKRKLLLA